MMVITLTAGQSPLRERFWAQNGDCPAAAGCPAAWISPRWEFFRTCGFFLRRDMVMYIDFPSKKLWIDCLSFLLRDKMLLRDIAGHNFGTKTRQFWEMSRSTKIRFFLKNRFRYDFQDGCPAWFYDVFRKSYSAISEEKIRLWGFQIGTKSCPARMSRTCPAETTPKSNSDVSGNVTSRISWTSR